MVDDIKPHIIAITESWANNDITDAELGLEGYECLGKTEREEREEECYYTSRKINNRRKQIVMVQISYRTYNSYHWSSLVVYRCPNIIKQNNEKIHNAISCCAYYRTIS